MRYEVPIVYHGQSNYIVEATSAEEAEMIARRMFEAGDSPATCPVFHGNEWETIDRVGEITKFEFPASTAPFTVVKEGK